MTGCSFVLSAASNTSIPFLLLFFNKSTEIVARVKSSISEAQHEREILWNNSDVIWDLPKDVWKCPRSLCVCVEGWM